MSSHSYLLGHRFQEIVEQQSDKAALKYPDGSQYSYCELDKLSNQIAHFFLKKELKPGDVVGIFNEKSVYGYCTMLACIKTGIIYTNLDGSSPWSRIGKIIERCQPGLLIYDLNPEQVFEEVKREYPSLEVVEMSEIKDTLTESDTVQDRTNFHGNNPAYIMFTSGSTGFPKGAAISHQNLLNFIEWGKVTFSVTEKDVFTNANPIYFDNSVFDFYVSIFNGATLVPICASLAKNPKNLVQAINDSKCTIWFSVPSLLVYLLTTRALSAHDFSTVTRISFGGEGFPKNKLKKLFEMFGQRIQLFNVYGPTECTCICSSYIISSTDFEDMTHLAPLGHMAPNFGYEILSENNERSALGELCLTGPGVGLGYYNDPERTEKSFVQNPYNLNRELMYRTGDLVEKKSDGLIHFKGRIDNQIKHMGYRIELEEIEAAFSTLSYVNEVGVVYEQINAELGQIKAFISINEVRSETDIKQDVGSIVPSYMVPRMIHTLDILPKNQNGKIDRKALKQL